MVDLHGLWPALHTSAHCSHHGFSWLVADCCGHLCWALRSLFAVLYASGEGNHFLACKLRANQDLYTTKLYLNYGRTRKSVMLGNPDSPATVPAVASEWRRDNGLTSTQQRKDKIRIYP